jgi:hypothetical protein
MAEELAMENGIALAEAEGIAKEEAKLAARRRPSIVIFGSLVELKPCPFCGGDPAFDAWQPYRPMDPKKPLDTRVTIYCTQCEADMGVCKADMPGDTDEDLADYVASLWNRRCD